MTKWRRLLTTCVWLFPLGPTPACCLATARSSEARQLTPHTRNLVGHAVQVSKQAASNITAAYDACDQWHRLLPSTNSSSSSNNNKNNDSIPDPGMRAMCFSLQASCLIRTGQDEHALQVYEQAIQLKDCMNAETLQDVLVGKASSYQRLMQYDLARDHFLQSKSPQATLSATTCALRLDQMDSALSLLLERQPTHEKDIETNAMLATVQYLQEGSPSLTVDESIMSVIKEAGASHPLYQWIYRVLSKVKTTLNKYGHDSIASPLDLAALNTCAFDDPRLIHLDDKVLLHQLLTTYKPRVDFWPRGLLLPEESDSLSQSTHLESTDADQWFCKSRAGYGSHGNTILNSQQALQRSSQLLDSVLLQRMVQPPLLLQGRKFSLRIYVVYFGAPQSSSSSSRPTLDVFISTQGLVKLAALPYSKERSLDLDMQMTNSGREMDALQQDLAFLQAEFAQAGWSFSDLWKDINHAVQGTMLAYEESTRESAKSESISIYSSRSRLAELHLPKILGFDFVLDASQKAWVIEVNRFPGLEARDAKDKAVKLQIIRDAWRMAGCRAGLEHDAWLTQSLTNLGCDDDKDSLQRIEL